MMVSFFDYPLGEQVSPFTAANGGSYFAQEDEWFSYLGSYEQLGAITCPWDERANAMPGMYVLNILKRYCLVRGGEVIYLNPNFDDGHVIGASRLKKPGFMILSDHVRDYYVESWRGTKLRSSCVQDCSGPNTALQPLIFDSVEKAIGFAQELTAQSTETCIVSQWFADLDRH